MCGHVIDSPKNSAYAFRIQKYPQFPSALGPNPNIALRFCDDFSKSFQDAILTFRGSVPHRYLANLHAEGHSEPDVIADDCSDDRIRAQRSVCICALN